MNHVDAPPRWLLRCLQVLGAVWTSPNTLLGLVAGSAALAGGAHWHWRGQDLALVFHRVPWGKGGALTLGNVILHTGDTLDSPCLTYAHHAGLGDEAPIRIGDHERAHVYQYMVLGPLFLPLYLVFGGVSVRNRFERAADRYAQCGRGWWPFRRTAP
ncbi:hypothetical protein GCM10010080_02520 [Thermomonas carbonis]|uniref:Uncharacterized protein n=1 Tax=Thermomonas carbonis TaxID=1463158 RepID=A0A7G9SV08_9GAMM|nr:hypothetical protein [Thermomonas carbonis]QNN71683.1 hypothetical protein H9L16_13595 [Thermomonas carbonis]GHB94753.1 hypothetical protein GCM10010080_02520 [Thermomonas carbonis]